MVNGECSENGGRTLVIGGASMDTLHLATGQTVTSAGGAGLYTALAAHCSGVKTAMLAPRPDPMPEPLQAAVDRLTWIGPRVPPDQLPHFEIAHHGGGRATLMNATWGAEILMTPDALPPDLRDVAVVHVAALRTADRQLTFTQACRERGAPRLSAGTYSWPVKNERDRVQALFDTVDVFFMNENEANLFFGGVDAGRTRPGCVLFVTLGENGARVIQGDHVTHVPGRPAAELDPTGAGDTFCGATLAGLARGEHPVMAARAAVALAAEMIGAVGPARLISDRPPPGAQLDDRCVLRPDQIQRVADLISRLPDAQPFDFTGEAFPPVGHPAALDFFFAVTLQQFGFWEMRRIHRRDAVEGSNGVEPLRGGPLAHSQPAKASTPDRSVSPWIYHRPMIAVLDGRTLKGSDYVWHAYRRRLDRDPDFCSPARQGALTESELAGVFRSDDGINPMPAFDLHLRAAQAYGRDMQALNWTPAQMIAAAARSDRPRSTLLDMLTHVGGYKEDPLRKKAMLLALILDQRPERFLPPASGEAEPPVIDYHLMRSCLRIGLVEIGDPRLKQRVIRREVLSTDEEWAIRYAAYRAIEQVQRLSGRGMGAVDWFFFGARHRCPEMTEPDCAHCAVDPVCAHRKELFQPVFRTTLY